MKFFHTVEKALPSTQNYNKIWRKLPKIKIFPVIKPPPSTSILTLTGSADLAVFRLLSSKLRTLILTTLIKKKAITGLHLGPM